jgi:hypothetical protein
MDSRRDGLSRLRFSDFEERREHENEVKDMKNLLRDDVSYYSVVLGLVVMIATMFFCGCQSTRKGKVLSGTATTIGLVVPVSSSTSLSFNILEYVSGLYLGMSEDSDLELDHEMEIDNSYFGVMTHKEKRKLTAHITNYGKTNMLVSIKNKLTESQNERSLRMLEIEAKLKEAEAAIAVANACKAGSTNDLMLTTLKERYSQGMSK